MPNPRRSMGNLKMDAVPQRGSMSGIGGGRPSSNLMSASKSRLPKPSTDRMRDPRKRSTSIDARPSSVLMSSKKTPRSHSAARTPASSSQNRRVLAPLSTNSEARYSMTGGATSRGSFFGTAPSRDTRPINDKEWQRNARDALIAFCVAPDSKFPLQNLNKKDFPLDTSKFKIMFEFLYGYLQPNFKLPPAQQFQHTLPELMKRLGYPGAISRSTFQTLGSLHSWPTVLGALDYLLSLAKTMTHMDEVMIDVAFPTHEFDSDGFSTETPSTQRLEIQFFMKCYARYNSGKEQFEDEFYELYDELMNLNGISQETVEQLDKDIADLKATLQREEEAGGGSLADLQEQEADKQKDYKGLQVYLVDLANHLAKKRSELDTVTAQNEGAKQKIEILKESIEKHEAICRDKGIDPYGKSNAEFDIAILKKRVETKREAVFEADSLKCKAEQQLSKRLDEIDGAKRTFKRLLFNLDDDEVATDLRTMVDRNDGTESLKAELNEIKSRTKADIAKNKKDLAEIKESIQVVDAELTKKAEASAKLSQSMRDIQVQKTNCKETIDMEQENLDKKLAETKSQLDNLFRRDKDGGTLGSKEKEFAKAKEAKLKAETELEDLKKEGEVLLADILKKYETKTQQELAKRQTAFDKYKAKCKEVAEGLDALADQVQQKLDNLEKI